MISKKFFPYFLVSLILLSSMLPYGIDLAHAQAPPPQSGPPSTTSITVGSSPNGISFAPVNNDVYVANSGSNTVSVISSTTNNVISTINVGTNPGAVAYDPANQDVYVTNGGSNNVSVISTSDNTIIATIPVGTGPNNLAYDSANQEMYIANSGNSPGPSNTVSAISSTTNTVVSTITVDPNPIRLAFNPTNNDIYVDNYASGEVTVIDGTNNAVIKTISVGANPNTIGYDPANNDMYVTSNNSDNVFVISSTTNNVIATLNVGTNPFGVFYDPANQEMFVSSTVGNTVSAIRDTGIVSTVNVGTAPYNIIFNPTDNDMYVLNTAAISGGTSSISVIDNTNTVVATLTVGTNPDYSTFDPSNNDIYVSNTGSGTVSMIPPQATGGDQPSETVTPQQSTQSPSSASLSDNFVQDSSLNTNLWQINGPVGTMLGKNINFPQATIVNPAISFSISGLGFGGVDGTYESATLQSTQSFSAPFTAQATVMASAANGNPFEFMIVTSSGSGIGISGNLNPNNGDYYGIWESYGNSGNWDHLAVRMYSSPSVNVLYQLQIAVSASGLATVTVSSGGNVLGSSNLNVGTGSFYLVLLQNEGAPFTVGPNQAYWQSVQVTGGNTASQSLPPSTTGTTTIPQSTTIGPLLCRALNGTWNDITQTCTNSFPQTLEARMMVCGQLYSALGSSQSQDCVVKAQTLSTSEWENYLNSLSLNQTSNIQTSTSTNASNCVVWTQNNPNPSPLNLNYGIAQPNLWNLASASGNMQQCLNSGSLQTSISLSNIQYNGPGPVGYPEIGYGYDLHDHPFGSQGSLSFPSQVASYANQNYWTSVSYSLEVSTPNNVPQDFTYDLWLKQNPCADSANNCALQKGDYEIMVEPFDTSNNIPASWTSVGAPFQEQIIINNIPQTSSWQEYTGPSGTPNASLVAFVLSSPSQYSDATISLKLQDFINAAGGMANKDFSNYYLMGIEVGAEFGSNGSNGGNPISYVDWGWAISNFSMSNPNTTINIVGSSTQTTPTSTTNAQSQSSISTTTLPSPTGTIGIQNIITVNSFNVISSSGCENTLTVQLTSCFTMQQNFIINNPLGSISSYAPQNVIEVGTDKNGKMYAGALFMVFNGANNAPIACNGVIINDGCDFIFSLQPTSLPVKFYLTSTISNGQLLMNSNWGDNHVSFPFRSLPTGSTILLSKGVEQPQLDIVGSATGNGKPGNTATFSSADIDVESFVQLLNSPSWTSSIIQTTMPCYGTSTAEQSFNLEIEMTGTNTAHFYYNPGNNCQKNSQDLQGVGYMPNITSQTATTTTTTNASPTGTTGILTTTTSNPSPSYQITFTESGLQQSCIFWIFGCSFPSWSGALDGNPPSSSTPTSITFNNVNPGQLTYSITSPTGYSASPATGTIQVSGNTNQAITFSQNQ